MAERQVRPVDGGISESLLHLTTATVMVAIVYLIAGLIGSGVVTAIRYFTG